MFGKGVRNQSVHVVARSLADSNVHHLGDQHPGIPANISQVQIKLYFLAREGGHLQRSDILVLNGAVRVGTKTGCSSLFPFNNVGDVSQLLFLAGCDYDKGCGTAGVLLEDVLGGIR